MANNFFYYLTIASIIVSTASCDKEESANTVYEKAYPVILKAQSIGLEADKTPESYLKGESIGVSLLETETNNVVAPNSNIRYLSDGIGFYFVAANNDSTIYLPENGDKRDIATYYPKVTDITDKVSIDLITNPEFGAKLQFGRINGLNKDNREAVLKMKNALSLVTLDIDASAFGAQNITATLQEMLLKGNMSIYNGEFEATEYGSLTMTEVNALSRTDNNIKHFYAMAFPATVNISTGGESTTESGVQATEAKIEITITKEDDSAPITIEIKLADYIQSLESAMNTNFNVTVDASGTANVKVTNTNFSINDWVIDGDGIEVDGSESL